jgi:DNA-binding transcriptional LysR family regulator
MAQSPLSQTIRKLEKDIGAAVRAEHAKRRLNSWGTYIDAACLPSA